MLKNAQIGQPVHSQPVVSTGSVIGQVSSVLAVIVLLILACGWLAKRLGFDPAVMASPFITTIVDALALLAYFGISLLVLSPII